MANPGINHPNQHPGQWDASFTEQLLLVESDAELRESRCLLLSALRLTVQAVGYHPEVFSTASRESLQIGFAGIAA
jgi:hypothetical protein